MVERQRHRGGSAAGVGVEAFRSRFGRRASKPTRASRLDATSTWLPYDAELLADLANRLAGRVEELSAEWAQRLLLHLEPALRGNPPALEALAWVNTWYLEDHLARLRQRKIDGVLHESFERHLRLLRSQRSLPPESRLTLAQLYQSLEISSALFTERALELYAGDERLPGVIAAIGRLSLHLGQSLSQAFHEVRSEELQEALRVSSSVLETAVELNTRSASVAPVVAHLSQMIAQHLSCDRTLTFLWLPEEGAFAPADGTGVTASELEELKQMRFRAGELPVTDALLRGEASSGSREDGRVANEMMQRFGCDAYAVAPMVGSDRRPLGVLAAYRAQPAPFRAVDLRILEGLAQNAALALENARLVEQLEAADHLKSQFINSMSHEMRTPLNVIFGYLEMLGDELPAEGEGQAVLERLRCNAGYLVKLVNSLLDIGRIDSGRMPLNVETFTVDRLFEELQQVFGPVARSRGLEFECVAEGDLGSLTTDRLKLLEVLNNLLSNAFKFTDSGRVTVRAIAEPGADRVRFEVIDTGIGIEPEAIEVVFELFRQAGSNDRGGTGLGLYVVKRLTDLLNGDVGVESAVGRGSCFGVEIPRVLAA